MEKCLKTSHLRWHGKFCQSISPVGITTGFQTAVVPFTLSDHTTLNDS